MKIIVYLLAGLLALAGCERQEQSAKENTVTEAPTRPIERVLEAHVDHWMAIEGVVGAGIGECEGKPCINVLAARLTDAIAKEIPKTVEGYRIEVVVTGIFRAGDSLK